MHAYSNVSLVLLTLLGMYRIEALGLWKTLLQALLIYILLQTFRIKLGKILLYLLYRNLSTWLRFPDDAGSNLDKRPVLGNPF